MAPHTITSAVGAVCRCNENAGLRRSPSGVHKRTRSSSLLRLNLDDLDHCSPVSSCVAQRRRRWMGVKGSTRNGCLDPKCPSARRLRMVREDTWALVKVVPVPGLQPMKQLSVLVHF
ncbi:uncharacterized protein TNCV_1911481 [Trichonephila clavipes]|nr:uncharacterized protein TNCV_1911481 [Trichonephila clavipes]